jgi:hypothetical protein
VVGVGAREVAHARLLEGANRSPSNFGEANWNGSHANVPGIGSPA